MTKRPVLCLAVLLAATTGALGVARADILVRNSTFACQQDGTVAVTHYCEQTGTAPDYCGYNLDTPRWTKIVLPCEGGGTTITEVAQVTWSFFDKGPCGTDADGGNRCHTSAAGVLDKTCAELAGKTELCVEDCGGHDIGLQEEPCAALVGAIPASNGGGGCSLAAAKVGVGAGFGAMLLFALAMLRRRDNAAR
jgi:hypothetical protein